MMRFGSAYKMFYKHLVAYVVILLVPLIIFGVLIYYYFIGILKEDVLAANLNKLDHTREVIDNQIEQLYTISTQLNMKNNDSYFFRDSPLKAVNTISELRNYTSTNKFITDILFYYRGDDYIYSSTSSYKLPFMLDRIYRYESLDAESFTRLINDVSKTDVRPIENIYLNDSDSASRFITFVFPLSLNGFRYTRTALMLAPEDSFKDLMMDTMKDYSGNTAVIDGKGRVLVSLNEDEYMHSDSFQELLNGTESTINQTITLDHKSFLFSYVKSDVTGWQYVALVPAEQIMNRVTTSKLIFIYLLVFVLVVSGAIIYLMMRINYQPIYRLKQYTDSLWKENGNSSNELDHVRDTLEFLNSQNDVLSAKLQYHSYAARDYFLFQLLKGALTTNEEIALKSQNAGINLADAAYRVITFQFNRDARPLSEEKELESMETLERLLPEPFKGYFRDQFDLGRLIAVLAFPPAADNRLDEVLEQLKQKIDARYGGSATIGAGSLYTEPVMIPKSYIESLAAIDYRLLKGAGKIIYYEEISVDTTTLDSYPHRDLEKLKLLIKQGNTDQINAFMDEVVSYMRTGNASVFVARMICFDILSTVLRTFNEINKEYASEKLKYPDVFGLTEFESIDELAAIVGRLSDDIDQFLKKQEENRELDLIDQMIGHLRENYINPDFNIQQLAERFQMSQAKISQYFKERTGQNLIDYETELKMERAKLLLRTSKLPLRDIALNVGYYNVTSFIRRFKQMIAMTPGEYRKLYENHIDK